MSQESRLFAEQLDCLFALGPERHDAIRADRQLRLPEVELARDWQEPRGLLGFVEQGAQDHPVVGTNGGCPIGAAGGVLMKGTGPPNVGAGAIDLGVIDGRDMVAMPELTGAVAIRRARVRVTRSWCQEPYSAKDSSAFQAADCSRARTDWVMVCSSTLIAMAVIHSAKRWKPRRVNAQAKALSKTCQMDQVSLASVIMRLLCRGQ